MHECDITPSLLSIKLILSALSPFYTFACNNCYCVHRTVFETCNLCIFSGILWLTAVSCYCSLFIRGLYFLIRATACSKTRVYKSFTCMFYFCHMISLKCRKVIIKMSVLLKWKQNKFELHNFYDFSVFVCQFFQQDTRNVVLLYKFWTHRGLETLRRGPEQGHCNLLCGLLNTYLTTT